MEITKHIATTSTTFSANRSKKAFWTKDWIISSVLEITEDQYLYIMPYYAKTKDRFYFKPVDALVEILGGTVKNVNSQDGIYRHITKNGFIECRKGIIYGRRTTT